MYDSDTLLKIESLGIHFEREYHDAGTLRDFFVNTFRSPFGAKKNKVVKYEALSDFDLEIKKGDKVAIIGVNGAGKTTLCRCVAGMLEPTCGTVKLNGVCLPIFNTSAGLLPELTGRENAEILSYFVFPFLNKQQRKELLENAISFSEIGSFIDTPFMFYSKGMQARLFLSLISSRPADLLIFDEVLDGADVFFQEKIRKRFKEMISLSGAVIFVTHNLYQVKEICNRLVLINHGKKIYDGDIEGGLLLFEELGAKI